MGAQKIILGGAFAPTCPPLAPPLIAHFHQVPCSFGICEHILKVKLPMFLILSMQLLSTFTNVFSIKETFL